MALFYLIPAFLSLYNLGLADFRSLYQFNLETSLLIYAFSLNYIFNYREQILEPNKNVLKTLDTVYISWTQC